LFFRKDFEGIVILKAQTTQIVLMKVLRILSLIIVNVVSFGKNSQDTLFDFLLSTYRQNCEFK